jgi:hypothetical protein
VLRREQRSLTLPTFLDKAISHATWPLRWLGQHIYGADPVRPERNGFEFGSAVIFGLVTLRLALGVNGLPRSLNQTPDLYGQGSASVATLGAFTIAISLCIPWAWGRLYFEQFGLLFFGIGVCAYALAVNHANAWQDAQVTIGQSAGLTFGSMLRWLQIWWFLKRRHEHTKEQLRPTLIAEAQR